MLRVLFSLSVIHSGPEVLDIQFTLGISLIPRFTGTALRLRMSTLQLSLERDLEAHEQNVEL